MAEDFDDGSLGGRKWDTRSTVEDPTAKRMQEQTDDYRELCIRATHRYTVQPDVTIEFLLSRLDKLRAYGAR